MYRCTGCGSTESIEEIRRLFPGALSCCPERKMEQVLIDDAMVERALVKWWQIDHISEGGAPEFIVLSMRDMRQALEAALNVPATETV